VTDVNEANHTPADPEPRVAPPGDVRPADELEVVDGLPVLSSDDAHTAVAPAEAHGGAALVPSRQVAALAATGFAAGAATVAMVHRHRTKKLTKRIRKKGRSPFGEVVSSNSFLVDVHLLRRD
jgi:hypothetical protein